jgi:uncharacterized cofD-like protein
MTHPNRVPTSRPISRGVRSTRVVALGGGHGLSASLRAMRLLTDDLTAVVTVADNGGSSGRIRKEMAVLPPGDLRMALAALCDDSDWGLMWRDVVQHRFRTSGDLDGHALGNLLIVTTWQLLGDPIAGLDWVGSLLGARGRVLPMALEPLDIEADVVSPAGTRSVIRGQAQVAETRDRVEQVRLLPAAPPAPSEVVDAIMGADLVVLGPGSWYTSVLPHLLVPELRDALVATSARTCLTMNLAASGTETNGMTPVDLLDVLQDYAPDLRLDSLVADPTTVDDISALTDACRERGVEVLLRQVSIGDGTARHDPVRLAAAYRDVIDQYFSDVGKD